MCIFRKIFFNNITKQSERDNLKNVSVKRDCRCNRNDCKKGGYSYVSNSNKYFS